MIKLDSDVEAFNQYVKAQVQSLSARGETSNDLLINLFKGYKAANDVEFAGFIRRKENSYEEGEDVDTANLMSSSLNKYKARKLVNKWAAPTREQEQILALTAQVQELTSTKAKPNSGALTGDPKRKTPTKGQKDNKWAWKDILPKDEELTTKDFNGKTYHVNCQFHPNQWVYHSPAECKTAECSKNPSNAPSTPNSPPARPAAPSPWRLQAAKFAASLSEAERNSGAKSSSEDY
jgi:hypothetical protein